MDDPKDQPTDRGIYRVACTRLKIGKKKTHNTILSFGHCSRTNQDRLDQTIKPFMKRSSYQRERHFVTETPNGTICEFGLG